MDEHVLRAVDGIECEAKLESELPIPVVREPSISFRGDGDVCRITIWTAGATSTPIGAKFIDPGALIVFGATLGKVLIDPCLDPAMQPAATVNEAPLAMCGGESARWLCSRSRLRARTENLRADGAVVTICGAHEGACVETDEPMEAQDRVIGIRLGVVVRLPAGAGVCVPPGVGVR